MKKTVISKSVLHPIPADMRQMLMSSAKAHKTWEDITPIARNEWVCWVTMAKKDETRKKRLKQAKENLAEGQRRPCCWPGCPHRRPNARKWFS